MAIDAALAAELAILTEAIDDPDIDVADSVARLAANARAAVASYCGLMVIVTDAAARIALTALDDGVQQDEVSTSLMLALASDGNESAPRVTVILFAGVGGAFVDLAADLDWMTGPSIVDLVLDQHLDVFAEHARDTVQTAVAVNQALGVLIGRGLTPDEAEVELDNRAARAGTDRHQAATVVLASIPAPAGDERADTA